MHTPVLLKEAIDGLGIKEGNKYIDATAGEGGHIDAMRKAGAIVLGIELDPAQYEKLVKKYAGVSEVAVVNDNYANIKNCAMRLGFTQCDGVLFDFGLSMEQIRHSGKGFTYRAENEPLDMRLGADSQVTAADLLNGLSVDELYSTFALYSEELHAKELSEKIVEQRIYEKFKTVGDLTKVIDDVLFSCQAHHAHQSEKTYAQIFQSLRIAVNDEYRNIEQGMVGAYEILKEHGRLVIITFHSGEDRIVKQLAKKNNMQQVNKKPITGNYPFERSAKMRIYEKIN